MRGQARVAATFGAMLAAAMLGAAPTAQAQLQDTAVGAWAVSGHTRDGAFTHCAMSTRSAHASRVLLFYVSRRSFQLAMSDPRWNLVTGTRFEAFYQIDGGPRVAVRSLAIRPAILNFTLAAENIVFEQFRTASALRVGISGSPEFDADFTIANSAAAFDRLFSCARAGMAMRRDQPAPDGDRQAEEPGHNRPAPPQRATRPPAPPPSRPAPLPGTARPADPPATARPPSPPAHARAPESPERPAEPSKPAEPRLIGAATGFYVSQAGHLLTAAHVVRRCKTMKAQLIGDVPAAATLIAKADSDDLALLKTETQRTNVAPLRAGSLRLGEQIVLFGFPFTGALASSGNLTTGNIAGLAGYRDDHRKMQISAPSQPGNSGGPVLDLRGRVTGVLVSGLDLEFARRVGALPQNINFAVKASLVLSFLEAHGVRVEQEGASQDLAVADVAERARSFTARIDCFE